MNVTSKIIFIWYILITILAIVSATRMGIEDLFFGLLLMWFCFLIFLYITYGHQYASPNVIKKNVGIINQPCFSNSRLFFLLSVLSVICSFYATIFYTGKNPIKVYAALQNGLSLYNSYQSYFRDENIGIFSFAKAPAIISNIYIKFLMLSSSFYLFVVSKKNDYLHYFSFVLVLFSFMFFSIARGTSFEFFELLILLWFILSIRNKISENTHKFSGVKGYLILLGVAIGFVTLYSFNISLRYSDSNREVDTCIVEAVCLDRNSFLFYISPPLAILSAKLAGYFVIGLNYTNNLLFEHVFSSLNDFFYSLLPFSSVVTGKSDKYLCYNGILNCGPTWVPDTAIFITRYGAVVFLFIVFTCGKVCQLAYFHLISKMTLSAFLVNFYMLLFMISLPSGNFISSSSSNVVICFISLAFLLGSIVLRGSRV